jgi:hypothetical protein
MPPITIRMDVSGLTKKLDALQREAPAAIARSLNRAIASARDDAEARLSSDLGVSRDIVRRGLAVTEATPQRLFAALTVSGKPTPLIGFGAVQTAAGVTSRFRTVAHGFIARMPSGHVGAFRRTHVGPGSSGLSRRGRNRSQLPIGESFGPSLATAFRRPEVYEPVAAKAGQTLAETVNAELQKGPARG